MKVFPPGMTARQFLRELPAVIGGVAALGLVAFTALWERVVWGKKPPR